MEETKKLREQLSPIYDNAKSFYGKAETDQQKHAIVLYSYNARVAKIQDGKAVVFSTHSQTTLRHIKEFLKQNGFTAKTKQQIITDYSN